MLKKDNRLRLNKDFDRAFKLGQSFYGKTFGLRVAANKLDQARFGILINTKLSKKANIRNKLRRQVRSVLARDLNLIKVGYDVVILVFPQILDKNFQELSDSLRKSLKRLNLYKNG